MSNSRPGNYIVECFPNCVQCLTRAGNLLLLLNTGYKQGSPAIRHKSDEHQVVGFEVYGSRAIASIQGAEDTLKSRYIQVTILRTAETKGNLKKHARKGDIYFVTMENVLDLMRRHGMEVSASS